MAVLHKDGVKTQIVRNDERSNVYDGLEGFILDC